MVPKAGLEPARVSPLPPQDSVSTKFHHFGTYVYPALLGFLLCAWCSSRGCRCRFLLFRRFSRGFICCCWCRRRMIRGFGRCRLFVNRWRCSRLGRSLFGDRRWTLHHDGASGPVTRIICQSQRREHKNNCGDRRQFAQKCGGPGAAEEGLTGPTAECRTHVGAFAGLKQNNHDQCDADHDMNSDQYVCHGDFR
jgi:hypothetical protein